MHETLPLHRKKVLYLITKSNFGGAQRYVLDMATHLPRSEYDVVVVAGGDGVNPTPGLLFERLQQEGIRTIHLPSLTRNISLSKDVRTLLSLIHLLREERPHVVHINSSKAGVLGSLAARIAQVPRIVFTAHGWPFWELRPWYIQSIWRGFSILTVWLAHITICISEADAQALHYVVPHRKQCVIKNGIEPYHLYDRTHARSTLFDETTLTRHKAHTWVVTVAELTPNKNILRALDVIALYNTRHPKHPLHYVIIGSGELETLVRARIQKLGLEESVTLLGFVRDVRLYYAAFDIFFLPSVKEGVPYVLLEALYAQLHIVASAVGGIPEIITSVLTNPHDTESMVSGLEIASQHKVPTLEPTHSVHTMVTETLQVY